MYRLISLINSRAAKSIFNSSSHGETTCLVMFINKLNDNRIYFQFIIMILSQQHFFYTLFFLIAASFTFGQTSNFNYLETGQPFVKYYDQKDYKSSNSNWSIVQDKRGVMYFGNGSGVLEFDGNTWRKIEVPYSSNVRSIAMDSTGTIYVCASADFGYLKPDSTGQLKYKSLMSKLDQKYRNFGEMWDVAASSEAVYFKSSDQVFRWNGKDIFVWDSVYAFRLYNVDDTIYSRNSDVGLMMINGDSIKLMPDGKFFANTGVYDMLPFDDSGTKQKGRILVTTNYDGLFLLDGTKFTKFKTEADKFLVESQLYNSCITAEGNFAFATQRGGVALVDRNGKLLRIINEKSGFPTNVTYDVFSDKQGGLWLSTVLGLAYCEVPSPFTLFKDAGYLKNLSSAVIRFNGRIYVGNEFGVLYYNNKTSSFQLLKDSNRPAYGFLDAGGALFAATNWGVVRIDNEKISKPILDNSSNVLISSNVYPNRVYAPQDRGLSVIQKQNNKLTLVDYEQIAAEEILQMVEESDGSLWLAGFFPGIIHVTKNLKELPQKLEADIDYKYYKSSDGLPGSSWQIFNIQNIMILATDKGVFRFDKKSKSFVADSTLGTIFMDSTAAISNIETNYNGDLWILAKVNDVDVFGIAKHQSNRKYTWKPDPVFNRLNLSTIHAIYSDYYQGKEVLWLSTEEALIRYDPAIKKQINNKYQTLIRKVVLDNDSIIFSGFRIPEIDVKKVILPFAKKNIRFVVSSINFDKPDETLYEYFLEGNDETWSPWTVESKKEYTNLSAGKYVFHVRAKNIYGIISDEDTFAFSVLPPWYLTWWAFAFYVLLLGSGIFIIDRIMRYKIINRERDRAMLREAELIKRQAQELETVDRLVRVINNAEDLEKLFKALLEQTVNFIPQAEKAAVFLLDRKSNQFNVAYTSGYEVEDLDKISFTPDELKKRYTETSNEIEKGIYIVNNTKSLYADVKLSGFSKPNSMLVMEVEWDSKPEAYVVFDSFTGANAFDSSTARILHRFREHAVSAISKAQSLKILQEKNEEIIRTQEKLLTQEKLASLGALTAGIAHEIKNPLNFVNNFSEISQELLDEIKTELKNNHQKNAMALFEDLSHTLEKINTHGKRADSIVKGMLLHSRGSSGEKVLTNINDLLDQYVALAYHGMRAQDKEFNITIEKNYDQSIDKVNIIPQDISRVFLNIVNNACYDTNEKKKTLGDVFNPVLKVSTKNLKDKVEIRIEDNGNGIPASVKDHIFNPFYTTKPTGEGTGLGLSLSYDIVVKQHNGEIKFNTVPGEFTEFIIHLPIF